MIVHGYMCKVDFDHELGAALGGNTIYPSIEDLVKNKSCVDQCGIVRVRIELDEILQESDWSRV